jgi:class 3 adenylate cyclase/tetratricopeptide (TPR) repeat protein
LPPTFDPREEPGALAAHAGICAGGGQKWPSLPRPFLALDSLLGPGHDYKRPEGTIMDLGGWLRSLGLERYEAAFRENEIDETVLPRLTHETLRELGVTAVGHRLKLLDAIAALRTDGAKASRDEATAPAAPVVAPEDRAERRQVTVMFSDLVGSTALSARMDPEDLREIISAYQKAVAETVQRFGGFVAKYMGDGVLVYFGYPQAHEDDVERAVRAGLELIQAVGKVKSSAPLQTRVGIATGLVVVGDLIGSGAAQEQAVVGETPNLAARLQGIAEPNMVVIAESTRRILGNLFDFEDLGAKDLKGISGPVQAWAALRPSSVESRFEALRTATTPLVGRDEEIDLLLRRWEQAKHGDGGVVLISGEPGIGKSRIAQTIVEWLAAEPHTRLRFFCSPHHQDSALYPSIAQLERAAGFRREDTAEQRLEKLEAVLAQGTNDLSQMVPLLADLLAIPTGDSYPPLGLSPQKRKEKTLQAQVVQIEGLAARQPVLMVWEDVHWSDPTTRESLDLIIDRVPRLQVLMVITFRPEFTPPWIGRPHVTMLTLNRLPRQKRAEMIAYMTGGKALPKNIAEQIIDRTDGVPLFIEELTKTVVESGIVTEADDHYAVAGPVASLAIPTSLHASLLARLDRLAPTREVAQIGAVLGRTFTYELIRAVAGVPQQKLDEALEQLASAELIFRRGTPPDSEYAFKHALVQDAAYSTLLRSRRQQLHARIATTLESRFTEVVEGQPELVAHHCAEAGLTEKAIGYRLKAGQRAVARSAMLEAISQLQNGLDLLNGLPEGQSRQQLELDLRVALQGALAATRGYAAPELDQNTARSRELCEQLSWPSQFLAVLYGQFVLRLCQRNDLGLALQVTDELYRFGEARNDDAIRLAALNMRGITHMWRGEFVAGCDVYKKCLALDPRAHRDFFGTIVAEDTYVAILTNLACGLSYLGYLDRGRERDAEALEEARALSHPFSQTYVLGLFFCHWTGQDVDQTLQRAEKTIALSTEGGFPMFQLPATMVRGWCLAALGQPEVGIAQLQQGVSLWRSSGAEVGVPFMLTLLADAYGKAGQPEDGLRQLAEAELSMRIRNERVYETELHRMRGELLMSVRDFAGAEASFREAIAVAQRQSAKLFELRSAMSMARLWHDQGKRQEARELLAPVYGWFTEGLETPCLKEARTLLDTLAS